MKLQHLLLIASLPIIIAFLVLTGTTSTEITPTVLSPSHTSLSQPVEVFKAMTAFVETLNGFLLAILGGVGFLIYKLRENLKLGRLGSVLVALSLGFPVAGLYCGYEAHVAAMRMWVDTSTPLIDKGLFHTSSSGQAIFLALGAMSYGTIILALTSTKK